MADALSFLQTIKGFLDVNFLINTFGYPGLFVIIFAETGLMLGFFLPGDSLLITAGIFASKGLINITILIPLLFVAATVGNMTGYAFGQKVGKRLFQKEDSVLFHKKHLVEAHNFYNKHGGKAIIIARFIPIIRTFAPIVAGMADMRYTTFLLFNIVGSLLWAVGLTFAGFFIGRLVPNKYFEPIIFAVIIISLLPGFYHGLNTAGKRKRIVVFLTTIIFRKK